MLLSLLRGLLGTTASETPAQPPNPKPPAGEATPRLAAPTASGVVPGRVSTRPIAKSVPRRVVPPASTRLEPLGGPATVLPGRAAFQADEPVVLSLRMAVRLPNPSGVSRPKRVRTLKQAGLGTPAQRRALRRIDIRTTADLLASDTAEIAKRLKLSPAAENCLRRWQRAIRLARRLPAMTPRDALLLIAVHRGSLRQIAAESPGRLHRDLTRFSFSTAGSRLLGDQPLPARESVRRWVEAARGRIDRGSPRG